MSTSEYYNTTILKCTQVGCFIDHWVIAFTTNKAQKKKANIKSHDKMASLGYLIKLNSMQYL